MRHSRAPVICTTFSPTSPALEERNSVFNAISIQIGISSCGSRRLRFPVTASEIKTATCRLVAQCLNQLRHLLFYPDEDRRSFRNVAKFLPDYTASQPARWRSHHAHPRDNRNSREPNCRSSYFPDLTSQSGDQTPAVGGFAPADIQCCWARTFSGLNPDQDTVHIHVVFCVVPHRIRHS
jgi:hypothetical protein